MGIAGQAAWPKRGRWTARPPLFATSRGTYYHANARKAEAGKGSSPERSSAPRWRRRRGAVMELTVVDCGKLFAHFVCPAALVDEPRLRRRFTLLTRPRKLKDAGRFVSRIRCERTPAFFVGSRPRSATFEMRSPWLRPSCGAARGSRAACARAKNLLASSKLFGQRRI